MAQNVSVTGAGSSFIRPVILGLIEALGPPAAMEVTYIVIRPVSQADMASPSFAFTQFLLVTNADWRGKIGAAITKRCVVVANPDAHLCADADRPEGACT